MVMKYTFSSDQISARRWELKLKLKAQAPLIYRVKRVKPTVPEFVLYCGPHSNEYLNTTHLNVDQTQPLQDLREGGVDH